MLGTGSGGFGSATDLGLQAGNESPFGLAVADLNGDQISDLAAVAQATQIAIRFGSADGELTTRGGPYGSANSGEFSVVTGDFNGDDIPDLAIANNSSTSGSILFGTGGGAFSGPTSFGTVSSLGIAVGDLNGDGALDIAESDGVSTVTLWLNTPGSCH
jgi:hypothetical protein